MCDHERAVIVILEWLHKAEDALVGATIQTFSGEAGTCKGVRLDDNHGLCFTLDDPVHPFERMECGTYQRWYPVSTIRNKS